MNINEDVCYCIILVPMEILVIMVLEVVEESAVVLVARVALQLVTVVVLVLMVHPEYCFNNCDPKFITREAYTH